MRRAIEKLTFLVLSFAAASLLSFALLARVAERGAPSRSTLPLLVNTSPRDARDLTLAAVRAVAADGPAARHGRASLARLGGAALPHVLPLLETLEPAARGRVALALAPIARRMGVASEEDLESAERAVVFFTRFWQDRSADFRSAGVRRKVQRLAERALPLRRKEVLELDTFALGELLEAIGRVESAEDVKRVERLSPVLAHITGVAFPLPQAPSVEQAATVATAWRSWAFDHGTDFTTLDGPGRLAATVLETRYFRFLASVPRAVRGEDPAGRARLRELLGAARSTLPLALLSLVLAIGASTLLSHWLARRGEVAQRFALAALLVAGVPLSGVAIRGAELGEPGVVVLLSLGLTAILLVELQSTRHAPSRLRRAVARAGTLLPLALAVMMAADALLERGLGALTLRALERSDLDALIWIAWLLSATTSLCILLPDARPAVEPDRGPASELVPGRRRTPILVGAAAVLGGFGLLALLAGTSSGPLSGLWGAAGTTLAATAAATATAGVVALVLGLLAGGISRSADVFLSRSLEITYALPQPLVACSAFTFGAIPGAALLGVLRGIEVGQVLRVHLAEQRAAQDVAPPSLGRAPLSPYLRRVLPAAIGPAATTLALTGSWLATLDGAGARLGAPSSSSLATLMMGANGLALPALLLLTLLSTALCLLVRDVSPVETSVETPGGPVVLALKRRIDSTRPPSGS